MVVGPKMQPICRKFLESMLAKLVMFSPEVANVLLVGPGSTTWHVQKSEEEGEAWPLPPTHLTISCRDETK